MLDKCVVDKMPYFCMIFFKHFLFMYFWNVLMFFCLIIIIKIVMSQGYFDFVTYAMFVLFRVPWLLWFCYLARFELYQVPRLLWFCYLCQLWTIPGPQVIMMLLPVPGLNYTRSPGYYDFVTCARFELYQVPRLLWFCYLCQVWTIPGPQVIMILLPVPGLNCTRSHGYYDFVTCARFVLYQVPRLLWFCYLCQVWTIPGPQVIIILLPVPGLNCTRSPGYYDLLHVPGLYCTRFQVIMILLPVQVCTVPGPQIIMILLPVPGLYCTRSPGYYDVVTCARLELYQVPRLL